MDWRLDKQAQQWDVTSGAWRAIVIQLHVNNWYPYVERLQPPNDRYDGPSCESAVEGRIWCETKLAEMRAAAEGR